MPSGPNGASTGAYLPPSIQGVPPQHMTPGGTSGGWGVRNTCLCVCVPFYTLSWGPSGSGLGMYPPSLYRGGLSACREGELMWILP